MILAVVHRTPPRRRRWSTLVVVGIAAGALGWTIAARAGEPDDEVGRKDPRRLSSTEINKRVADPVSTTWSLKLKTDLSLLDFEAHGTELQTKLLAAADDAHHRR